MLKRILYRLRRRFPRDEYRCWSCTECLTCPAAHSHVCYPCPYYATDWKEAIP